MLGISQPHSFSFQWNTAGVSDSDDLQDNKYKQPGIELKPATVNKSFESSRRNICQE